MAVQEQTPLQEYTANGIAKQFDLEFDCESADHLIVSIDDLEVLHTDWYLSGNAIMFHVAPANGTQVKIQRNTPFNRLADYQSYNNSFRPPAINKDFDRIWWKLQELGVADWILSNRISALKTYVDDRDDELRAYLMEEIRKQGVSLDQLDEYYNYLMERLAQIAVDKGWDASFVVDASGESQQQINNKTPVFCDTVAQLRTLKPRINGAVMFVKSHSNNGSGGVVYTWNANSAALDDDGWIIKSNLSDTGRWVADFGNAPITPQHFGAIGDGSVDERLICEKSIVAASKTSKHWLVPFGKTYLLNSYATYSVIANYAAGMLPVLSNTKYELQGTLKVGSYFDDRAFLVFTDVNGTVGNFIPVRNWKIFGMGDIDLSLSGKRRTTFKIRTPIYLETSYEAAIETIKIHSGDTPNAIVTGGEDVTIDGVRFIDLMQDNSANDDHSSIYAKARNTHIKNCYFKMSSINGNLNACPVELHNSDSSFKDSIIKGYRNTHILAAITVEFPYIENLEVSGLKANVHRNFANLDVWTGAIISNVKVHDNECRILPFPSDEAITAAGLVPAYTVGIQAMLNVTNDSALGYDLQAGAGENIQYYDNTYISNPDTQVPDDLRAAVYFAKAPISGISVFRNTIRSKNIILASPELDATDKLKLDRFVIKDNDFDEEFLGADKLINLNLVNVQSSVFDLKFKREFSCNNLININVIDTVLSVANNFVVHPQNTRQITKCVNVTTAVLQNPNNRISYPETVAIYFGGTSPTVSDFFRAGVKTARILDRLNVPATVHLSDYVGNVADSRVTAICMNPNLLYGNYNIRLLLEN